jgi:hypothetical protein
MTQRTLRIPGTLKHTSDEQTDVSLQEKARAHAEGHPGLLFMADVLRALHGPPAPLRDAKTFYGTFSPREVMEAFAQRPDLRVKVVKAITGSPAALLRRLSPEALASQVDLLGTEDLPDAERSVRAEADRALSVHELFVKYLDPIDIATYVPAQSIWTYESHDGWWKAEPTASARALMAVELRSVRRLAILNDSEILDLIGDETLERHLSLAVRTSLRRAARRAAGALRPFTDTDLFAAVGAAGGTRDLIDEMVENVPLPQLREVIVHAGRVLGLSELDDSEEPTVVSVGNAPAKPAAAVPTPIGQRIGPKPIPAAGPSPSLANGQNRALNDRVPLPPPPRSMPPVPGAKGGRPAAPIPVEAEGPPQPDDDLAFLDEISGRV